MTDYTELIDDLRNGGLHGFSIVLKAADTIEKLVKERDAAINTMKEVKLCEACKHWRTYPLQGACRECYHEPPEATNCWEWKGVKDET